MVPDASLSKYRLTKVDCALTAALVTVYVFARLPVLQMRKSLVIRSCGPTLADGDVSLGATVSVATASTVIVIVSDSVLYVTPLSPL